MNWATGGLSDPIDVTSPTDAVWVVETARGRALITSSIEAPRLAHDFDLPALGWEVLDVPWFEPEAAVARAAEFADCSPQDFISDHPTVGLNIEADLVKSRMVLSPAEQDDLRALGAVVGQALGAGIESWRPGVSTDLAVAAVIAGEIERAGAKAVCLIVGGDERLRSFRHPLAVGATISDAVMAVVVARRGGLHVAATRVAVADPQDPIIELTNSLWPVHDAVLHASLPGGTWGSALATLAVSYAAAGRAETWREHFQGGPIAFEQREFELAPGQTSSPFWCQPIASGTAVAWNPSAHGGAKIEETYLVGSGGLELLTATPGWPTGATRDGTKFSQVKVVARVKEPA